MRITLKIAEITRFEACCPLYTDATIDLETCKLIIELSLGINIRSIAWKEGQKVVHNLPGRRGIRNGLIFRLRKHL